MKKVLITGASSGIGESLAYKFASEGFSIVIVARRKESLLALKDKLETKYKVSVEIESLDLVNIENLDFLISKYSNIDILINNAGFGVFNKFNDYDIKKDLEMINLNIGTVVYLTKGFSKIMKKGSTIINIASTAGFQPTPYMSVYGGTKSFIIDFTLAIQNEVKDVNINLYCPGETQTEFQSVAKRPKSSALRGKIPTAAEVANDIYKNLNKKIAIYGTYNKFLIFITKFFSKSFISKVLYKIQSK